MNGRRTIMVIMAAAVAATCVAAAKAGSEAMTAGGSYKVIGKWGKSGTGNGQFRGPFGIATDRSGTVYVADTDNNRVQVFSAGGAFLRKWGATGSGNGQFLSAQDVAVDPQGGVWVADYRNDRVQKFSSSGAFQLSIAATQPTGVGVDADGNLFVQEASGRVTRYEKASDYTPGTSWKAGGKGGDLEVASDGTVFAADPGGLRVVASDGSGKAVGSMRGGLSAPIGVGVDLDCNVWIGQIATRRVAKFSPRGKLLTTASTTDVIPEDIAVGPKGDLYVLGQSEVLRFAEDRSKPATANIPGKLTVSAGPVVKVPYTLSGVACPAEVGAAASLTGTGISGTTAGLKLKAGAKSTIEIKLAKGALKKAAASGKATFKIVLKTNGRPTTETRSITLVVPAGVK